MTRLHGELLVCETMLAETLVAIVSKTDTRPKYYSYTISGCSSRHVK